MIKTSTILRIRTLIVLSLISLTDSQYSGKLPAGHYLKTYSEKNIQKLFITTVPGFDVKILNNNTDLCIQVYDLKGNIISDADVQIRQKKLQFDYKTQLYVDKKSNRRGLLKVSHNGYTGFYNLSRQYNNSAVKRGSRILLYGTPLKYIWMPVNFVIHLPIDATRSVIQGWPQGTISRTARFFTKAFYSVASIFDSYYYDYYGENKFGSKHKGYMVFNKPKYLPGDTVKFKAFLVSENGKPVTRTVNIVLHTGKKSIELTKLKPYSDGAFEYQFFLHDSLDLQLDRDYYVSLEMNEYKEYISESFKYEDYELSKSKLVYAQITRYNTGGRLF
ncbi:MAG: hypothetical protein MUO72_03370 [Bacteroidales bacterium]|nr:hypothetical protein [Bacteroidales bacterium]